jgi:N-acetylglucosamine malate deacetylase 2
MNRKIVFVFPHPDDEAFPSGGTLARYGHSEGVDTYLYTLTRGESSRNAASLNVSPEKLAQIRSKEVLLSSEILNVTSFRQGDYPDKGLQDLDPRILERDLRAYFLEIKPDVVVSYDVQGGSGHSDHIVLHHVLKRLFLELREEHDFPKRLAFVALPTDLVTPWPRKVFGTPRDRINANINVAPWKEIELQAIKAHESMSRDVQEHNYENWMLWDYEYYAFFQEDISPPVDDLLAGI